MTASSAPLAMLSSAAAATASGLPDFALQLDGLSKTYAPRGRFGAVTALDHIDLKVPRGAMFGLLGPNGAGKSTMINILAGLVVKTGGKARIWTHDVDAEPRQSRAAIGVVPQELLEQREKLAGRFKL